MTDQRLRIDLSGIDLPNPVLLAAGTAGTLDEMADVFDLARIGGIVTKSITAEPREGNRTWRLVPTRSGMLNAIGLANPGVEVWKSEIEPRVAGVPTNVIGSISGFSVDDYVRVAAAMDECDAMPAVELNVSCPNVKSGTSFGSTPDTLRELVAAVRPVLASTRLFVKLSPIAFGPPGLVEIAQAAVEGDGHAAGPNQRPGVDGLCIANTMPAMAIDVRTRLPRLSRGSGGLSGPSVHPVAVKLVYDVHRGVARDAGVPIIGIGGVMRWEDAAEFVIAGATAVEMGTALFADPRSPIKAIKGLSKWVRSMGAASISELVGTVDETYPPPI